MSFAIDHTAGQPAYLQIVLWLEGRMRSGELGPGDRLPSERALSTQVGAARGTVKNAYRELERRGCIRIVPGSGVYANEYCSAEQRDEARETVVAVIEKLRGMGLARREIEELARDWAWARLQKEERPRLAWVDCCPEMLPPIAREIEVECGFSVQPLLLHEVTAAPELLVREYFQTIATSIEHCDELAMAAQEVLHRTGSQVERIVLSLTSATIAGLAAIGENDRVAVVHTSQVFVRTVRRYLAEFGVKAPPVPVSMEEAEDTLAAGSYRWAVLPPDESFREGACGRIARRAGRSGVGVLFLRHGVDFGSLRQLASLARASY